MKKNIVIDLDGTLLNTNTFHKWIFFSFRRSIFINPFHTIKILYLITLRLIKKITHKKLKYEILKITQEKHYEDHIGKFLQILEKYENKKVLEFLNTKNANFILATAAPQIYVKYIAKKYNFTYSTSTPSIHTLNWHENIRKNKEKNLLNLLKKSDLNSNIDILITDHYDDIYLAKQAKKNILVNPSIKTVDIFKKNKINYSII